MKHDPPSTRTLDLPADSTAPHTARVFVRAVLAGWGVAPVDDAVLLTSEAVSESVTHADTPTITVTVDRLSQGWVHVEIHDHDHRDIDSTISRTRASVGVIDSIVEDWGIEHIDDDGEVLWFIIGPPGTRAP